MLHEESGDYRAAENWYNQEPAPEIALAASGEDNTQPPTVPSSPAPVPVPTPAKRPPAPAPSPAPSPAPAPSGEDSKSWFRENMIESIIIIVVSVFLFMTIILLGTSYRTYRTGSRHLGQTGHMGELPRPLRGRRTAARLGVPQVFSQHNLQRLHYLGDMPQIPPLLVPRYATRYRHVRRGF